MKKQITFILTAFLIACLFLTSCTLIISQSEIPDEFFQEVTEIVYATVNVDIRSDMSATNSDNIVGSLKQGEEIIRTGYSEEWSRVIYNKKESYIKSAYLSTETPTTQPSSQMPEFIIPDYVNNIGSFETTEAVYEDILRNPGKHNYTKLTITKALVIRDRKDVVNLCDIPTTDWEKLDVSNVLRSLQYCDSFFELSDTYNLSPITVKMRDDTNNRVLSGDLISITGIFVVHNNNYYLIDCTYTIIEANWHQNNK